MEEYVDVFDKKYTKMWKTIAWVKFGIHCFFSLCIVIFLVTMYQGLAPYIKGTEVWENMPFTLSQLEAIFVLLFCCWLALKTIRGLGGR